MSDKNKGEEIYEHKMAVLNNSILKIRNILDEDFTHNYMQIPYTIRKGEELHYPYPVGMHLAKHMAKRFLRLEAKKDGRLTGKGDVKASLNLFTPEKIRECIKRIIIGKEDKPLPRKKTDSEILKEKTDEMQKEMTDAEKNMITVTKKEVMDELRKRDIKFNARDSKEELLKVLMADETK